MQIREITPAVGAFVGAPSATAKQTTPMRPATRHGNLPAVAWQQAILRDMVGGYGGRTKSGFVT